MEKKTVGLRHGFRTFPSPSHLRNDTKEEEKKREEKKKEEKKKEEKKKKRRKEEKKKEKVSMESDIG